MSSSFLPIIDLEKFSKSRKTIWGNPSVSFPSQTIVKAKLEMTEPGDCDEIEADKAANEVVNGGKIKRKITSGSPSSGVKISPALESCLSQMQGNGQSMPSNLQSMMETGFGRDFSHVKLHTDTQAANMSKSINAKAFTLGNDIYFNQGQFSPNTTEGQRLIAHELAHVAQGINKVGRDELDASYPIGSANNRCEEIDFLILAAIQEWNGFIKQIEEDHKDYELKSPIVSSNHTSLVSIGGRGVIATDDSIEAMMQHRKEEVLRGTLDNMRGGPLGGLTAWACISTDYFDAERIYACSNYGANIDTALQGLDGIGARYNYSEGFHVPDVTRLGRGNTTIEYRPKGKNGSANGNIVGGKGSFAHPLVGANSRFDRSPRHIATMKVAYDQCQNERAIEINHPSSNIIETLSSKYHNIILRLENSNIKDVKNDAIYVRAKVQYTILSNLKNQAKSQSYNVDALYTNF